MLKLEKVFECKQTLIKCIYWNKCLEKFHRLSDLFSFLGSCRDSRQDFHAIKKPKENTFKQRTSFKMLKQQTKLIISIIGLFIELSSKLYKKLKTNICTLNSIFSYGICSSFIWTIKYGYVLCFLPLLHKVGDKYQVVSNQKRLILRLYYKNSYLEIRKSNFYVIYVTFFEEFTNKNIKFESQRWKFWFLYILYEKNYKFPFINIILSLSMMVDSYEKVKFSWKIVYLT